MGNQASTPAPAPTVDVTKTKGNPSPSKEKKKGSAEEDKNQYENLPDMDSLVETTEKPNVTAPAAAPTTASPGLLGGFFSWGWGKTEEKKEEKKTIRPPEDKKAMADWKNDNYRTLNMVPDNDKVFVRKSPSTEGKQKVQKVQETVPANAENYRTLAGIVDPFKKKENEIRPPQDKKAKADWKDDNYRTLNMVPDNDKVFARKSPSTPKPPKDGNAMAPPNADNYRTLAGILDPFQQKK